MNTVPSPNNNRLTRECESTAPRQMTNKSFYSSTVYIKTYLKKTIRILIRPLKYM